MESSISTGVGLKERLAASASAVETVLRAELDGRARANEVARPSRLMEAMRHGVLNGGKRLRPFLVLETAALFGGANAPALRVAAALECVHCYSLVHDDLPAMDDDDLRRGQPTVHRAFDEATAILAGDGLLTLAFDIVASPETRLEGALKAAIVCELARAAGCGGMAGGQMLDLMAPDAAFGEAAIVRLQSMKTGALIRFACRAGGLVAGAPASDLERLTAYGERAGLAFQIADDLLDMSGDAKTLGKATGKDADAGKATLPGMHGPQWARKRLAGLIAEIEGVMAPYGTRAAILLETARFLANRDR